MEVALQNTHFYISNDAAEHQPTYAVLPTTSHWWLAMASGLEVLVGVVPGAGLPWSVLPWVGLGHTKPLWVATMTPTHLPAKYPNLLGSILGTWWLGPPTDLGHWWLHLDYCLVYGNPTRNPHPLGG